MIGNIGSVAGAGGQGMCVMHTPQAAGRPMAFLPGAPYCSPLSSMSAQVGDTSVNDDLGDLPRQFPIASVDPSMFERQAA